MPLKNGSLFWGIGFDWDFSPSRKGRKEKDERKEKKRRGKKSIHLHQKAIVLIVCQEVLVTWLINPEWIGHNRYVFNPQQFETSPVRQK